MDFFGRKKDNSGKHNSFSVSSDQEVHGGSAISAQKVPGNKLSGGEHHAELFCEIETIPDFLQDHRLVDKELLGRLKEHCRKWTTIVNGLQVPGDGTVWWLRYRYVPSDGRVYIGFFGRLCCPGAEEIFTGVCQSFKGFGIELKKIDGERIKWWKSAYTWDQACIINQKEDLINTLTNVKSGNGVPGFINPNSNINYNASVHYLVNPWWGPGGTYNQPFDVMLGCKQPVEIGICLVPSRMNKEEKELLEKFGAMAKSAADSSMSNLDYQVKTKDVHDPNAEWLSRISIANRRRLDDVFLCSVFVLSSLHSEAFSVAKSVESVINEELPFESVVGEERPLFSRAAVKVLDQNQRREMIEKYKSFEWYQLPSVVLKEFGQLVQTGLSGNYGDPGMVKTSNVTDLYNRIRFMVDSRGAATVFRFPVSVNSGVSGIDVRQLAPTFIPGKCFMESDDLPLESIYPKNVLIGNFDRSRSAVLPVSSFRQHALITGFTGSGKTQTVLHLLHQFWNKCSIPFLVIESAKQEYRGLIRVKSWKNPESLDVYTLGNSGGVPFMLNPFELLEGVRLELHISHLMTCLQAAFPQLPFLTSIMNEALINIYKAFRWELDSYGVKRGESPCSYPKLSDFIREVERVTEQRGYAGENRENVNAAIQGRLKILQLGSLGRMLDCPLSVPMDRLFSTPTILEMNDLNEENKSLITMFLLVFLREYRELHPIEDRLGHVTVVEEAHNILEHTGHANEEISSDSKAKAVSAFCNMLTELRSYGEGLIIADQSPNKLAPDAMRNTNVQIAHQLRDSNDRKAVANAMIMTEEQRDFIGKLRPGHAAVFYTGLERAAFLKIPQYYKINSNSSESFAGDGFGKVNDSELRKHMHVVSEEQHHLRYKECQICSEKGVSCVFPTVLSSVLSSLNIEGTGIGLKTTHDYESVSDVLQGIFSDIKNIIKNDKAHARNQIRDAEIQHKSNAESNLSEKSDSDEIREHSLKDMVMHNRMWFFLIVLLISAKCNYTALKNDPRFQMKPDHILCVFVHLFYLYNKCFNAEILNCFFENIHEFSLPQIASFFNFPFINAALENKEEKDFCMNCFQDMLELLQHIRLS